MFFKPATLVIGIVQFGETFTKLGAVRHYLETLNAGLVAGHAFSQRLYVHRRINEKTGFDQLRPHRLFINQVYKAAAAEICRSVFQLQFTRFRKKLFLGCCFQIQAGFLLE